MTSRKCEHIRSYYLAMVTACVSLFLVASSLVLAVCNAVSHDWILSALMVACAAFNMRSFSAFRKIMKLYKGVPQ